MLTDYFFKLMMWLEEGEGDEQSRTVQQYEVQQDQVENNRLRHKDVLYDVIPIHECQVCDDEHCEHNTKEPEKWMLATISLSLAEALGLEWFRDDEGEEVEEGKDDGDKYTFKIIPVYLTPAQV